MRRRMLRLILGSACLIIFQTFFLSCSNAQTGGPSAPSPTTTTSKPAGLLVSWTLPTDTGTGITGYQVEYSSDGLTWTIASSTIPSGTYSYTISSLPINTNYYTRVAAKVSGGIGPYSYPWTKLYGTSNPTRKGDNTIDYQSGYGIASGDTATSISSSTSFTHVRYRMQSSIANGTLSNVESNWVDVNFAKWTAGAPTTTTTAATVAATVGSLQVPTIVGTSANEFVVDTNVDSLTVTSSVSSLVGFNLKGRLEIWPWNYTNTSAGLLPGSNASPAVYDFDDLPSIGSGSYGSFQVHDITNLKTIFSWSDHGVASPNVGYGNDTTGGNPDWTFNYNYKAVVGNSDSFLIEIFADLPVSTGFQGVGTVAINAISGTINKRTTKAITANTAGPGFVTFYYNGRKITNCVNVATVANVATCNWKPIITGQQSLTASFTSSDGSYTAANSTTLNATTKKR